jgi:putative protease
VVISASKCYDTHMNKPELILPGGDLERVKIALLYGADAVYVGLNKYSLRKAEVRFSFNELKEAIDYVHLAGKRIFVTFNIFAHNEHIAELKRDLAKVADYKPDAFIISDPGIFNLAQRVAPDIPIHLSTQANTVNLESVRFWQKQGVKRIVLGRELTLEEIKEIHEAVPEMELEIFVHGAMCVSYSGRCLLSAYMTGRNSNLGDCAQPCRWNYRLIHNSKLKNQKGLSACHPERPPERPSGRAGSEGSRDSSSSPQNDVFYLEEKIRPGEYYPIEETEDGTTIMSSKDLRLIRYLPEILQAGVTGLKVEGRNKSEYYLATTAYAYRQALKYIEQGNYRSIEKEILEKELEKLNYRGYTTGFLFDEAKNGETTDSRKHHKAWDYLGIICHPERPPERPSGRAGSEGYRDSSVSPQNDNEIVVKGKIKVGENVEILTPEGIHEEKVKEIKDVSGNILKEINPGKEDQQAFLTLSKKYPVNSILRKKI